jgi:hypothetical protein
MDDLFEIADLLVADAVAGCPGEISLIAYYGSHATGTATPKSDLDLFYVPVEGMNPDAARSFVVSGVTFDFWPISWETAERIADGTHREWAVAPSILANAVPLWSRSEEDVARLAALKDRIAAKDPARETRAREALAKADGALAEMRTRGWKVVAACLESLSLFHQVTFDGGWARVVEEVERFERRPDGIAETIRTIATSGSVPEILAAAERLVSGTAECVGAAPPDPERLRDGFAEIHEHIGKLEQACAAGDALRASLECRLIGEEVGRFRDPALPDLAADFDPDDLDRLAERARELRRRLVDRYAELGVPTNEFATADELAAWLAERRKSGPAAV